MDLGNRPITARRYAQAGLGLYALLVWVLLANQDLPFPLGEEDQRTVIAALADAPGGIEASWVADFLDPIVASIAISDPYHWMQKARRLFALIGLVGMLVWTARAWGPWETVWVGVLGLVFLPFRWTAVTLLPQSFFLAFAVWGGLLTLARPWSKTGTAEQFLGGLCLAGAAASAPWGWLFSLAIPLQALVSPPFRKRIERPFWLAFSAGLVPLLVWGLSRDHAALRVFGWNPQGLNFEKAGQILSLASEQLGPGLVLILGLGLLESRKQGRDKVPLLCLLWPLIPTLLLGFAIPSRLVLGLPGLFFLSLYGLRFLGRLFVSPAEGRVLSTLAVLAIGYSVFFGSLPLLRERQAHSIEVRDLADLLVAKVPPQRAVALFRLNPLLDYLNTLYPDKNWIPVPPREVDWVVFEQRFHENRWYTPGTPELWFDPKRIREPDSGVAERMSSELLLKIPRQTFEGKHTAEICRVDLTEFFTLLR